VSEQLDSIVESEPQLLATGFVFTEGPLWHSDGYLTFVDMRRSLLLRWVPDGQIKVIRENTGGGNGCTLDMQGRLVMCEGVNRRLSRTDADGTIVTLVDRWEGKRLNIPNDVVCRRSDGSIYFTDPQLRVPPEEREAGFSAVYQVSPDGAITVATTDCPYPNGLAFSPDERILYVANTRLDERCYAERDKGEVCTHRYIRAFDVGPDGSLTNSRLFADMSSPEEGVPDGMKVDTQGNVFCTGPGGPWVFDAAGNHLGIIRMPERPANCAFGGSDRRTLFFTARTSLYSVRVRVPGIVAF